MTTRRDFLRRTGTASVGVFLLPSLGFEPIPAQKIGVQLYSFRDAMMEDPVGTLKQIAFLGFKEIESVSSSKGLYYGLAPKEMKKICNDLGMKLISGHVALDNNFSDTMEQALTAGQEYVIPFMPNKGPTIENYKEVAEQFNRAGEACKKSGLKFGYHNHAYEFESDKGMILYDVLMNNTEPDLVHMELDLGWVVAAGKDPLAYFKKYPGRFPLWHLKDMDLTSNKSTEFGKGSLDIALMMDNQKTSSVKYIFIEQEDYANSPLDSMRHNMVFLKNI